MSRFAGWELSKTYSLVFLGFVGSFCLDFFKDASTYGIIIPAGFALIGGRMFRDSRPGPSIRPTPLGNPAGGTESGEGRGDSTGAR